MRMNTIDSLSQMSVSKIFTTLTVGGTVLALAVLFAGSISVVGPKISIAWAGLVIGPLLLFMRLELLLWIMIVSTFVVVGVLQYFFGVQKAFWIPYLLGLVLLIRLPIDLMTRKRTNGFQRLGFSSPLVAYFLLSLGLFVSTIAALPGPAQIILGMRDYFGILALMIILGAGLVDERFFSRVWTFLLWVVPAQLPAVIYQRFFVVSKRVGSSPWDAVVGLFGGDPEGGGGSGVMAVFVIIMSLVAFVRWQNGKIKLPFFLLVVASAASCIALAEVKFAFALIPIAVAIFFGRQLLGKPLKVLASFAITAALISGFISLYQMQFTYGGKMPESQTVTGYLERAVRNNTDASFINFKTGEMGRVASLSFWASQNGVDQPLTYIFGHGIGSTKVGGFVVGESAARFLPRFRIDRSTAAILLWDAGLFGFLCAISIFLLVSITAFRLARRTFLDVEHRILMPVMGTAAIIFLAEFPYHTSIANVPQAQMLVAIVVGYVIATSRQNVPAPVQQVGRFKNIISHGRENREIGIGNASTQAH